VGVRPFVTLTNAIVDQAVVGNFRVGVWHDRYDKTFNGIQNASPFASIAWDVRYRKMQLGDRDSTTGWRDVSYDSSGTVDMIIVNPQNRGIIYSTCGILATYTVSGLTIDPVYKGDQICTPDGWYKIVNIKIHQLGDSFGFRECELEYLPSYQET